MIVVRVIVIVVRMIVVLQVPYDTIQAIVREQDVADFSVYRLLQKWPESMSKAPPSQ